MPKCKGTLEEDTFLLYPGDGTGNFDRYSHSYQEVPIIKGVVNHLRRWPYDLLLAFLAACLIIGSLMLLVFVTVVFCFPSMATNRCRVSEGLELPGAPNAYFLKLENRTWSTTEFCYTETAARSHPHLNVYLINLLSHEPPEQKRRVALETSTNSELNISQASKQSNQSSRITMDEHIRTRLVSKYPNIRNIDVSIERLFKGSKLLKIVRNLPDHILEIAAKAELLWNSPGIVLEPSMYCNLKPVELQMCNGTIRECPLDRLATIDVENGIQATAVPCQAFIGFLIHEIGKNRLDDGYSLQTALHRYCSGHESCPEIRRLHLKSECSSNNLDCPTVDSSTLLDDMEFGNQPM